MSLTQSLSPPSESKQQMGPEQEAFFSFFSLFWQQLLTKVAEAQLVVLTEVTVDPWWQRQCLHQTLAFKGDGSGPDFALKAGRWPRGEEVWAGTEKEVAEAGAEQPPRAITAWHPWKALRTAARLSTPAWCSAGPASSPCPLGRSLPSRPR